MIEVQDAIITFDGKRYTAVPATVKSTHLGYEDHGIMTTWLHCEGPGWGQGVGGFQLDRRTEDAKGKYQSQPTVLLGAFVQETLKCLGKDAWEKIPGTRLHLLYEEGNRYGAALGFANADLTKAVVLKSIVEQYK